MKLWMRLLALCGLVLGMSCAHGPMPYHYVRSAPDNVQALRVIPIWIDKNFGEADRISLEDAIDQWNYALNGYVQLRVVSWNFDMETSVVERVMHGGGWMILKIDSNSTFTHDAPNHWTLAFANDIGGNRIYFIRDRIQNNWMTGLAMHEMAHLLGAKHDGQDLMQATFDWETFRCVDQATVSEVADYLHLPMSRLNYCVYGYDATSQITRR